jgi:hypothetical protein
MGSPKYTDKDWLIEQYIVKERTVAQICEELKIERWLLIKWLDEYKIYRNWRRL